MHHVQKKDSGCSNKHVGPVDKVYINDNVKYQERTFWAGVVSLPLAIVTNTQTVLMIIYLFVLL